MYCVLQKGIQCGPPTYVHTYVRMYQQCVTLGGLCCCVLEMYAALYFYNSFLCVLPRPSPSALPTHLQNMHTTLFVVL